jgi:hypothetical protein
VLLIEDLRRLAAREPSLFRAQLLREDAARLSRLADLARAAQDLEAYRRAGRRIGWTQGDLRTGELGAALEALLEAVFAYVRGGEDAAQESGIEAAWRELYRVRMERLVGCLSTPVPKPVE